MRRSVPVALLVVVVVATALPVLAAPLSHRSPAGMTFPDEGSPPQVSAKAWLVYDDSSGTMLAARNANERRAMASVTKIMTGLLTLEHARMDELVTVSTAAANTGEKEIDLVAGEELEMGALFKTLMVHSANDSATAIAEHISGSLGEFVDLMNERAAELGLNGTSFANPHGLDEPGHYTTANDLLKLTQVAMELPDFANAVRSKVVVIPPDPEGNFRRGETTDLMLHSYSGSIGVKTGFTSQALLTYVGAAERDGRRIYVVVLGSEGQRGHFADATELFDWAFDDFAYVGKISAGGPYTPELAWIQPDPIMAQGQVETFVHLSNVGMTFNEPRPPEESDQPPDPPPVVETVRSSEPPMTAVDSLMFWITGLFG